MKNIPNVLSVIRIILVFVFVAVFFAPIPDPFDKGFAPQIVPADAFFLTEELIHAAFGGDPGVVGTGEPGNFMAQHPVIPAENILQRIVEHMPQRQDAGHVGRRDDDGIRRFSFFGGAVKLFAFFPQGVPLGFHLGGLVSLDHFCIFSHD